MKAFILLTRGNTTIAKGIQIASWIYEKFGKNTKATQMYNHAVFCYLKNGIWWIQEALANGISKPLPFGSSPYYKEQNFVVKAFIKDYSDQDLANGIAWAESVAGTPYDFFGIGSWIIKTFSNKWVGKTGKAAQKELYCSEFAEDAFNMIIPNSFPHPYEDSPMNIYDNNQVLYFVPKDEFYKFING